MTVQIIVGDCREAMGALPAESVHCVVTSPPYWGLRDYGIPPGVWGGDPACAHAWGDRIHKPGGAGLQGKNSERVSRGNIHDQEKIRNGGEFCECGAWRGAFGLEPDYRMFVECFKMAGWRAAGRSADNRKTLLQKRIAA